MDKTTPMKNKPLVNATCKLGKKGCFNDGRCHAHVNCENKIMTNADRIRAMSDEELAEFLKTYFTCEYECAAAKDGCICDCSGTIMDWLQSEVEG